MSAKSKLLTSPKSAVVTDGGAAAAPKKKHGHRKHNAMGFPTFVGRITRALHADKESPYVASSGAVSAIEDAVGSVAQGLGVRASNLASSGKTVKMRHLLLALNAQLPNSLLAREMSKPLLHVSAAPAVKKEKKAKATAPAVGVVAGAA